MDTVQRKEESLEAIGTHTTLMLAGLSEEERTCACRRRFHQLVGMIEVLRYLPDYQGWVEPLERHRDWLYRQLEKG